MSDAETWRELEGRFRALQPDDQDGLRATWDDFSKRWVLKDAPSNSVLRRFKTAAEAAAVALGLSSAEAPPDGWLDSLKHQDDLFPVETGGVVTEGTGAVTHFDDPDIPRVCEVSADYCERLAYRAVAHDAEAQTRATQASDVGAAGEAGLRGVTLSLRKRRRELLKKYKIEEGSTTADVARRFGMSASAIHGIIRGDRSRYSPDTEDRFLKQLGVSSREWDGE